MKKAIMIGAMGVCLAAAAGAQEETMVRPGSRNIKDLQIRGMVQTQFGYAQARNDRIDDAYSTFEVRRVRMGIRGTLFDQFQAQIEPNLIPGSGLTIQSAFIEWREYEEAYIKVGHDRPWFGFEEMTSSGATLAVENSLISNTLAPGTMSGLSVSGATGMLSYSAGIYSDRENRNPDHETPKYAAGASVELKLDAMVGQTLRLRTDYFHSEDEGGNFGSRFEKALSTSLHFASGRFDLRAEYLTGDHRDGGGSTSGFYVMPSWRFTEKLQGVARLESASSDRATGLRAPGRYAQRVSGLQAPEEGPDPTRGDDYRAVYIGANYYLAGHNNKLMFGVEFSELDNTSEGKLEAATVYGAWRMLF